MATAVQVESIWNGLTDNSGQPLAAGKVFTYAAGTTTPVSLFTASDKSTSATNPLILDAYGKAQVWADGRYKFVVKTSADVTLYTLDNLLYGFDDTTVLYGGTSTGSANAHTVSVPATVTSYANGQTVSFIAGFTNTGATTLQFNSLSAVNLVKGPTPSSLQAGDLTAGQLYTATYHGGAFRLTDYPTVADVQRGRYQLASSVAGTNTITANLTPALSSYETGIVVQLVPANTNTGAATLALNGLAGPKAIQSQGVALTGGELVANQPAMLFYDGTNFQILSNNVGVGTAAAPAIYPGNDVNTGIFFPAADQIGMATNGTERVRLNASGTVDVKTTGTLEVAQLSRYSADANQAIQVFRKSRSATLDGNTIVQSGDALGGIAFAGANGTGYDYAASIVAEVDGTPGASSDMPGRLVFRTTADGSASTTERMRIASTGNVGIGHAGYANSRLALRGVNAAGTDWAFYIENGTPALCFAVRNDGLINTGLEAQSPYNRGTATAVNMVVGGDGLLYRNTSGLKYKRDIENATHGLVEVLQLRPVTYKGKSQIDGDIVFGGLIAEEVDAIGLSEFVTYDADGQPDALAYGNMVSLAFKAIQELNAKVEALEARVAELEA